VQQDIKDALNKIVHTTDQSEIMKKELKKNIYETVSSLRILVNIMQLILEEGISKEHILNQKIVHSNRTGSQQEGQKRASYRHPTEARGNY
jgi:hypothetical protein